MSGLIILRLGQKTEYFVGFNKYIVAYVNAVCFWLHTTHFILRAKFMFHFKVVIHPSLGSRSRWLIFANIIAADNGTAIYNRCSWFIGR